MKAEAERLPRSRRIARQKLKRSVWLPKRPPRKLLPTKRRRLPQAPRRYEVPSVSETEAVAEEVLDAAVPDDVTVEPADENDVLSVEDQTINGDLAIGASSSSPLEGEVPSVSEAEGVADEVLDAEAVTVGESIAELRPPVELRIASTESETTPPDQASPDPLPEGEGTSAALEAETSGIADAALRQSPQKKPSLTSRTRRSTKTNPAVAAGTIRKPSPPSARQPPSRPRTGAASSRPAARWSGATTTRRRRAHHGRQAAVRAPLQGQAGRLQGQAWRQPAGRMTNRRVAASPIIAAASIRASRISSRSHARSVRCVSIRIRHSPNWPPSGTNCASRCLPPAASASTNGCFSRAW